MGVPSNADVKNLLESSFQSNLKSSDLKSTGETLFQFGHLNDLFADDISVHINGHEFQLAGQHQSLDSFKDHLASDDVPPLSSVIDVTKPIQGSVAHVIGGTSGDDSDWKAVILKSTATTTNEEPWNHEMVVALRFNQDGKIIDLRAYPDTLHVHNHIKATTST